MNREDTVVQHGTYSVRLDVDVSASAVNITQNTTLPSGSWILFDGYMQASAALKSGRYVLGAVLGLARAPGTSWVRYAELLRSVASNAQMQFKAVTASNSYYFDNLSAMLVTYSSLFMSRLYNTTNPIVGATVIYSGRGEAGIVASLDDPSNPQNYVILYYNRVNIKLSKYLNQVETNKISVAVSTISGGWVDGELLEIRKNGTIYQAWYRGTQVGTDQTIDDAAIISNQYVGVFSDTSSTFDYFNVRENGVHFATPDFSGFTPSTYPAGNGVLSLHFDDDWQSSHNVIYPLLTARDLVAGFTISRFNINAVDAITVADLLEMQTAGQEIMCHTLTHSTDPSTDAIAAAETEVAGEEMRRLGLNIWSWVQSGGWSAPYNMDSVDHYGTSVDLLLRQYYKSYFAFITAFDESSRYYHIPYTNVYGVTRYSGTTKTLANLESYVDDIVANGWGMQLFFHANNFDTGGGNISLADFTTFLDYVQTKVSAGHLTVLTPTQQLFASTTPSAPTSLAQYKSDGSTIISSGGYTPQTSVVLKFSMSSINASDSITPQVEIQEAGTAFAGTQTNTGTAVAYSGTPVTGIVTITGLTNGKSYHWQARVNNPAGPGSWVLGSTFTVDTATPSLAVTKIGTLNYQSGTNSYYYTGTSPTFSGTGEAGATITLKVGGTVRATGTIGANGSWSLGGYTFSAGSHSVQLTATDAASNQTAAALTLVIFPDWSLFPSWLVTRLTGAELYPAEEGPPPVVEEEEKPPEEEEPAVKGNTVTVRLADQKGKPLVGIWVTLSSEPQTAMTNGNGEVTFANVLPGEHTLAFEYGGEKVERTLNLLGDDQDYNIDVTVEGVAPEGFALVPQWLIWALAAGLAFLSGLIIIRLRRARR